MIHKKCGGDLISYRSYKNPRWVISKGITNTDHPVRSLYSEPDALMKCNKCQRIGVEHDKE